MLDVCNYLFECHCCTHRILTKFSFAACSLHWWRTNTVSHRKSHTLNNSGWQTYPVTSTSASDHCLRVTQVIICQLITRLREQHLQFSAWETQLIWRLELELNKTKFTPRHVIEAEVVIVRSPFSWFKAIIRFIGEPDVKPNPTVGCEMDAYTVPILCNMSTQPIEDAAIQSLWWCPDGAAGIGWTPSLTTCQNKNIEHVTKAAWSAFVQKTLENLSCIFMSTAKLLDVPRYVNGKLAITKSLQSVFDIDTILPAPPANVISKQQLWTRAMPWNHV